MIELAQVKDVPILKAGTHYGRKGGATTVTEADIDETIEGSNELAQLMEGGYIPDVLKGEGGSRKLPGPLNLLHDDILDDTIRERVKDVKRSFFKRDGGVFETFTNVPRDVAKALKSHFPGRSVDLIRKWAHPETGKEYKNVVFSTAFLDGTMAPAVKGMSEGFTVELSEGESLVMTLYSSVETTTKQEVNSMADKTQTVPDTGKQDEVSELTGKLTEKDALIAELQAAKKEEGGKIAELEAARQSDAAKIAELAQAQDASDVREFMTGFKSQTLTGQGVSYALSPAFVELCAPLIQGVKPSDVIELAGEQKPFRGELKHALQEIAELAAAGGIVAALGTIGTAGTKEGKVGMSGRIAELMEADKTMSFPTAWMQAANETKLFEDGGK